MDIMNQNKSPGATEAEGRGKCHANGATEAEGCSNTIVHHLQDQTTQPTACKFKQDSIHISCAIDQYSLNMVNKFKLQLIKRLEFDKLIPIKKERNPRQIPTNQFPANCFSFKVEIYWVQL